MKKSKYNVTKTDGKDTWIYNTLNGSFLILKTCNWKTLDTNANNALTKELASLGILVEDDINEILTYKLKYYKTAFDNRHLHIDIAPTMQCNFACYYCFENGNKNMPIMSKEVEQRIVKYIIANKDKQISINWFGGEPLLGFDNIISISNQLDNERIAYKSAIITNGSLLTIEKIKKLDSLHLSKVQIGKNYVQNRTGFDMDSVCFSSADEINDKIAEIKSFEAKDIRLPKLAYPCMFRQLNSFSIDPQGNIYHCLEHLGVPENRIGNLVDGTISLTKLSKTMLGDNPFDDEDCVKCKIFPICGGGCPIDRLKKKRGENVNYCSIYKSHLADLLYLYEHKYLKNGEKQ